MALSRKIFPKSLPFSLPLALSFWANLKARKNLMKLSSFLWKNVRFAQYNVPCENHRLPGVYTRGAAPEQNKEEHHGNNICLNAGNAPGSPKGEA